MTIARHDKSIWRKTGDFHLQPLDGGIHVSYRAAGGTFLAHYIPGLQGLAQFQMHAASREIPEFWKPELEVRREPVGLQRIALALHVGHDIGQRAFQTTDTNAIELLCKYLKEPANGIWLGTVDEIGEYIHQQRNE